MKKKWMIIPVLLLVVVGMVMVGCSNSTSGSTDPGTGTDATWEVTQKGGVSGTATTTAITITFSRAVASLENNKVSVIGDATRTSAALVKVGDGTTWDIPISVTNAGMASVTFAGLTGIENGTKTVAVYKEGETSGITYSATPDGTANTVTSTSIQIVFADEVAGLEATEITFGNAFAVVKGTLLGPGDDGKTYSLGITPASGGATTITITHEGVYSSPVNITIHYKTPGAEDVVPPGGFDVVELGAFNVNVANANQKGWASNAYDGVVSNVEVEDFLQAEYLWIWFKNNPAGGMQIAWQGDGEDVIKTGWFQVDALDGNGSPAANVELGADQGGYVLKIKLADVLGTVDTNGGPNTDYTDAEAGIKIILGYYTGTGFASLGDMKAYLLLPEGTIDARVYKTVSFDTDGGTPDIADISVLAGYPLGAKFPEDPEQADKVFDGWEDDDNVLYDTYTPITDDVTLTAIWVIPRSVTFVIDDETSEVVAIGDGQALSTIEGKIPVLNKNSDGKIFAGWYSDDAFTDGNELDLAALITTDATYYAKWLAPVTITFALDGGFGDEEFSEEIEIPTGYSMDKAGKYPTDPKKPGYDFDGWKNASSAVVDKDTVISAATALTAQWTAVAAFETEKQEFNAVNNDNQKGWEFKETSWDTFFHAKYLVIKTKGGGAGTDTLNDGFGGLTIILQGDGNGWVWTESDINSGWTGFAHEADDTDALDTVYLVIDLEKLNTFATSIKGTQVKLFLAYYPLTSLGYETAYFTNKDLSTLPSGAAEMKKDDVVNGYITKIDPFE
jgi:uncharacterized repeat protein (TIGR02543 family)